MIVALNEKECYVWSIDEDIDHRKQKYSCPACRKKVLFRKGPQLIPHFAHLKNQSCNYASEPESMKHLSGKIQLYKRIKELVRLVSLEKFFAQIQQKADIYFEFQGKGYVVEFQCSQIPIEVLKKRTKGYLSIGITPIWVFHLDFVNYKGVYEVKVPKLVQSGIGLTQKIFLYDVSKRNLIILSQLTPFSKSTYFSNKIILPLSNITINHFIRQQLLPRKYLSKYLEKRHYHLFESIRFEGLRVPFYKKLYESGYSTFMVPPFVGVPLKNGVAIRTPVIEWQGLLFLELIKVKEISYTKIHEIFKKLIQKNWIETITICEDLRAPEKALFDYINLLKGVGFLNRKHTVYQINLKTIQSINEEEIYCYISQLEGFHKIVNN